MSFIRLKTINGARYAYEVENYWTSKGSRQRTKQYLGRVYTPDETRSVPFTLSEQDLPAIAHALARHALATHGFDQEGSTLVWNHIRADLTLGTFVAHDKSAVIELNEGFLCEQTYRALRTFTPSAERFEKQLATTLLAAGLTIPKDLFIHLFDAAKKRFKTNDTAQ